MAQQVLIIGAGVLGQALGKALPKERVQVSFFDINASQCPGGCAVLETAVPVAHFIFMCVPSWVLRQAVAMVSALIPPSTVVVSFAKGLESSSGKTTDEICTEALPPHQPVALIGGALLAHELASGLPGMGVIGCGDDAVAAELATLWQGSALQLTWASDLRSVAVAGVLKNVYAIALGIGDGLALGSNARGWLFAQAVREMLDVGVLMHADRAILLSVAGIGDLVATGLSPQSKNHTAGVQLAQTGKAGLECEGIMSLPSITRLAGERPDLRLLNALAAIVLNGQNARVVLQDLIYRKT